MTRQQGWQGLVALIVLPLLTAALAVGLKVTSGPDWLAYNLDPEYSYLLNALMMAQGEPAPQSVHPGTPVHLLGALAIRVTHLLQGNDPLPRDALMQPETYLNAFHGAIIGVQALSLIGVGLYLTRRGVSRVTVVLLQATPLLSAAGVAALHRVSPEPVLLTVAAVLAGVLVRHTLSDEGASDTRTACVFGVLCGLGLGAKVTFLPLFIVPVIVLRGLKSRALFMLVAAGVFGLMLWNPLVQPGGFFDHQARMATAGGVYGELGAVETPLTLAARIPAWIRELGAVELPALLLFLASLAVVAVARFRPSPGKAPRLNRVQVALFAIAVAEVGQLGLAMKSPLPILRYLIPAFGLLGAQAALLYVAVAGGPRTGAPVRRWIQAAAGIGLAALMVIHARQVWRYGMTLGTRAGHSLTLRERIDRVHAADRIAYHYRTSAQPFALWFGNEWVDGRYAEELARLYPDALIYDLWDEQFEDCGGTRAPVPAAGDPEFPLVVGTPWPPLAEALGVEVRYRSPVEWVYGPASQAPVE